VVELFGRYIWTLQPGLQWILPWVMEIRATIAVWEQPVRLFESPIKIGFRDGSATPKGAAVFVRMQDPDHPYPLPGEAEGFTGVYRAIYLIANWRVAVRDLIENALRSYLNGLTIDEAITMAKAGYDLTTTTPELGLPNHEIERIRGVLSGWGFELMRITITDFDLEPDLVAARGEVQKRERAADAARHEARIRALETTRTLIEMMSQFMGLTPEQVQQRIAGNQALQDRFQAIAEDLVSRQVSIAGKALTDIRVVGGDDLARGIMSVVSAIKKA
jgi:regulator of protease activity HflC (stomatin/prohibitin superfamily)